MKPPLRQRYVAEVEDLSQMRAALVASGAPIERVAKRLHRQRRRIGLTYKLRTPLLGDRGQIAIYRRNWRKYGDIRGPGIEWLRRRGRTWEEICESACRPGGDDLG